MKTTSYFEHRRKLPDRAEILDTWIQRTIENPLKKIMQNDGRMRLWSKIPEAGGKFLRVVLLADGETVHNAFFDRDFKD